MEASIFKEFTDCNILIADNLYFSRSYVGSLNDTLSFKVSTHLIPSDTHIIVALNSPILEPPYLMTAKWFILNTDPIPPQSFFNNRLEHVKYNFYATTALLAQITPWITWKNEVEAFRFQSMFDLSEYHVFSNLSYGE